MGKYDISTISRDELKNLLGRAKDVMVEYTRHYEIAEKKRKCINEEKKKAEDNSNIINGCFVALIMVSITLIFIIFYSVFEGKSIAGPIGAFVTLGLGFIFMKLLFVFKIKQFRSNIKYYAQLPDLGKKKQKHLINSMK